MNDASDEGTGKNAGLGQICMVLAVALQACVPACAWSQASPSGSCPADSTN